MAHFVVAALRYEYFYTFVSLSIGSVFVGPKTAEKLEDTCSVKLFNIS